MEINVICKISFNDAFWNTELAFQKVSWVIGRKTGITNIIVSILISNCIVSVYTIIYYIIIAYNTFIILFMLIYEIIFQTRALTFQAEIDSFLNNTIFSTDFKTFLLNYDSGLLKRYIPYIQKKSFNTRLTIYLKLRSI